NINILYAEDDKSVVSFIKIILKKINFINITFANNGKEALELYKKDIQKYQIVITDMIMPIMDGFELIKNIKNINKNQIIIMATAMTNKEDLIKAIELRVDFFIEKPIKPKKFETLLKEAVNLVKKEEDNNFSKLLLNQYKETIDDSAIVSKADKNGKITFVNDKFCEISGYTKDELIGKPHNIVRHPDIASSIFEHMWYTIKELKETWLGEVKNKKKDGTSYWVKATIKPIVDMNGNIVEYIAIRIDITQQQKIKEYFENQLQISTKQFDNALNLSKQYEICMDKTNSIIRTDTNGIITYVNDKFCNISGYTSKELIGITCSKIRDKSHIKDDDCNNLAKRLKNKEIVSILFKNISKKGEFFYMDTIVYPIKDIENNIIEHLHLMHNITPVINLNKEIEETQKEVVFTMGAIGETRSKETGNHVKRVAEYSYLLAKLAGLDEDEAQLIKLASPMHDIGKVGIPDSILNKPARLTKDEFEIMKTHSKIGYDMLKGSKRPILKASSHIALEHHERWDGKGYPNGSSGKEIHIYGRITSICDVFDALGSDRCYKKAWELEKILKLFKVEQGQQFDPTLMQLFLDNLDKFLIIRDNYVD
ncbi:MAG: PAS domain S-box protein, partial [Campylobacterota bacterium]|nr:PAS domain S-box protein [Campylobacterota bacterium]